MKLLKITLLALSVLAAAVTAGDEPRGYDSVDEFAENITKAKEKSKLIAILVKGSDDSCPNCASTVENGTKAIKSYCELIFTRVTLVQSGKSKLPKEITDKMTNLVGGASVHFFVYDPNTFELVASGTRKELQSDKKAIRAFKDKVREAKKALK